VVRLDQTALQKQNKEQSQDQALSKNPQISSPLSISPRFCGLYSKQSPLAFFSFSLPPFCPLFDNITAHTKRRPLIPFGAQISGLANCSHWIGELQLGAAYLGAVLLCWLLCRCASQGRGKRAAKKKKLVVHCPKSFRPSQTDDETTDIFLQTDPAKYRLPRQWIQCDDRQRLFDTMTPCAYYSPTPRPSQQTKLRRNRRNQCHSSQSSSPTPVSIPDEKNPSPLALAAASIPTLPTQGRHTIGIRLQIQFSTRTLSCKARHQSCPEVPRAGDKASYLGRLAQQQHRVRLLSKSFTSALFQARFMPSSRRPPCLARRRESRTLYWACRPRR
jgi:hypothetical protein